MALKYRDGGKGTPLERTLGNNSAMRYDYRFVFSTRNDSTFTKLEVFVKALTLEEALYLVKTNHKDFWVMLEQECLGKNRDWLTGGRAYKPKSQIKSVRVC
jgi:hypothetical protein